ncbi:MAG: RyR domain-containing protein [Trebonia sp.]
MIIGFGPLGRAVLRETARRRAALGEGPLVEVAVGPATVADVAKVAAAFPLINGSCRVTCGDAPRPPDTGVCTVFVCLDDFEESLREGLDVSRSTANGNCRVVICVPESSDFVATLAAARGGLLDDGTGRLSVFGVLQEACVSAIKADDFAEQLARSIHEAYVAHAKERGETEAVNPSMASWNKLSEDLRQSNLAQAADIGVKMEAIGAAVVPESEGVPQFSFTGQEIELLAQMEHERWMRERISQGWKYGDIRDPEHKVHPDLRDWSYLSDLAKQKDRDAISKLPGILHDAGFQIRRLPRNS